MKTRDLFIVRHAKSDWSHAVVSDYDRELSSKGEKDAPLIAKWLKNHDIIPEILVSSPAMRARQTADAIINQLSIAPQNIVFDKQLYLASIDTLLEVLSKMDNDVVKVMLIGHNPGLENLVIHLCRDALPYQHDATLLTPANVVHLQFKSSWKSITPKSGQLINFIRPESL